MNINYKKIKDVVKNILLEQDEFPSFSADDAFEFLWKTQGKRPPLSWLLKNAPDKVEKSDLKVRGDLVLKNFGLTQLPDNLYVWGNVALTLNPIEELPYNMYIHGSLYFDKTDPIPQKYGISKIDLEYADHKEKSPIIRAIHQEIGIKGGYVDKFIYFRGHGNIYF